MEDVKLKAIRRMEHKIAVRLFAICKRQLDVTSVGETSGSLSKIRAMVT